MCPGGEHRKGKGREKLTFGVLVAGWVGLDAAAAGDAVDVGAGGVAVLEPDGAV